MIALRASRYENVLFNFTEKKNEEENTKVEDVTTQTFKIDKKKKKKMLIDRTGNRLTGIRDSFG